MALRLSATLEMLASPCLRRAGRPVLNMSSSILPLISIWPTLGCTTVKPFLKYAASSIAALTSWLMPVAMAAPAVPRPSVCINSGSRPMFSNPPMLMPIMAYLIFPSARRRLFITKDIIMNGAAINI